MDIRSEITYQTARSGGKGGQNVNKVETMVEGYWNIAASALLTPEEKERIQAKLANRLTSDGWLLVKSQEERTQLGNKERVLQKMNELVTQALVIPKKRKPTRVTRAAKQKRLDKKKRAGEQKQLRQKIRY